MHNTSIYSCNRYESRSPESGPRNRKKVIYNVHTKKKVPDIVIPEISLRHQLSSYVQPSNNTKHMI